MRAAIGLADYGLQPGCWGDVVLVTAETIAEAVAQRPSPRTVFRRGRLVADAGRAVFTPA